MALTKAEMELHLAEYGRMLSYSRELLSAGRFKQAVEAALASCRFVDGMMRYERKYLGAEFDRIEGIDIVLRYGPLTFDGDSLNELADILKAQKQIDKNASADLGADLIHARERMVLAYGAWNAIAVAKTATLATLAEQLCSEHAELQPILEIWESMGILDRTLNADRSVTFSLVTDLNEVVAARCGSCGANVKAAKNRFVYDTVCPKCKSADSFTLIFDPTTALMEA